MPPTRHAAAAGTSTAGSTGRSVRRTLVDSLVAVVVGWAMWVGAQWPMWSNRPGGWPPGPRGPGADWEPVAVNGAVLPFVLVVIVGLALRRRWPAPAAAAVGLGGIGYLATGGALPPAVVAVALCAYALAATLPVHRWLPYTAVVPIMILVAHRQQPYLGLLDPTTYGALIFAAAVVGAVALLAVAVTGRREAQRQHRADELERAAAAERLRLAREVHDVVGHSLSVISMQAAVALHVLEKRPEQIRTSLEAIRTTSAEAMSELRHAIGVFRESDGSPTAPAPSLDRVDSLVAALRAAGRRVTVDRSVPTGTDLPTAVEQTAFRIVQEGLTNVVRHAEQAAATVKITATPDVLDVEVGDNGPLLTGPVVEGNGLRGMRERVAALGGRLDVTPRPTGGLIVHATLPLHTSRESR